MSPDTLYGIILGACAYHVIVHMIYPALCGLMGGHDDTQE